MAEQRSSDIFPLAAKIIRKYESENKTGNPSLIPYIDKLANVWTVGFGRKIMSIERQKKLGLSDKEIIKRYTMSPEEVEVDFDKQIETALQDVQRLEHMLPKGMTFHKGEVESLIPLLQNTGYGNVLKLNSGKPTEASKALIKGDKKRFMFELFDPYVGIVTAGGSIQKGLQARRIEEGSIAKLYEGGEYSRKEGGMISRNPYPHNPRPI